MLSDEFLKDLAAGVSRLFEVAGITTIVLGAVIAVVLLCIAMTRRHDSVDIEDDPAGRFRRALGRSILIGLELLVAADIIRTVAVDPTMQSVLVLGLIVLIRTFLSFSLEVEINGRWPWQREPATDARGKSHG